MLTTTSCKTSLVLITLILVLSCHAQNQVFTRNSVRRTANQNISVCSSKTVTNRTLSKPKLRFLTREPLKIGEQLTIECVYSKCHWRGVSWNLDDQALEEVQSYDDKTLNTFNAVSVVTQTVTADLNDKAIICKARQLNYPERVFEAKRTLTVYFKPLEQAKIKISNASIGNAAEIVVIIRSNPKPSLVWTVGDKKVYYGTRSNKFVSQEMSSTGSNYWNASLRIANLTSSDLLQVYRLVASNSEGVTEYFIQLNGAMTVLNITDISNETQLIAVSNRSVTQNAKTIPVTRGRPFKSNVKGTRQTPPVEITTQRKNLSEIVETTETSISATPGVIPITVTETIGFTIGSDMTTVSSNPNDLENDLENEMSLLIRIFSTLNSYWRTSLAIVCNLVLLFFLISYRLKIKKLKARLAERNFRTPSLGNTNSTGSFQRSSNAYTPTNYIQEVPSKLNAASADNNDYQLSSKSRSIYYTGVVNSSLHSYESIRENIYSEIYVEPDLHLYISDSLPRTVSSADDPAMLSTYI